MLSIGVMRGGQSQYYQQLAREDYYTKGGEPVGQWVGKGAKHFNLAGEKVTKDALRSLFGGRSPKGKPLVQNVGARDRRPGFDLTFSAPKTVSAWWATADENTRKEIQKAQQAAVEVAISYLERTAAFSRTGKAGVNIHKAGLVVATFEHGTSRALDPQLHTHALLMNVGVLEDGRTRALLHTEVFAKKMVAGALYRVELATQLASRLKARIELDPDAYRKGGLGFRVVGISQPLCDLWSKRREAIEKVLGAWGTESASAAAAATQTTREIKDCVPPRAELFSKWREEAKGLGIDRVDVTRDEAPQRDLREVFEEALKKTLRELAATPETRVEAKSIGGRLVIKAVDALKGGENEERAFGLSHFSESVLLRRLAENLQGSGIPVEELLRLFSNPIDRFSELVFLGKTKTGERLLTTTDVVKLEEKLLAAAKALKECLNHGIAESAVTSAIKQHNGKKPKEQLGPEREAAIKYLTALDGGSIRSLEGWAGTAKTTTLSIVKDLYEKAGYQVIGTAVAGKAVKVLRQSGENHRSLLSGRAVKHHLKQFAKAARHRSTKRYEPKSFEKAYTIKLFERLSNPRFIDAFLHHGFQVARQLAKKPTFKYEPLRINDKTLVICDEASMVDTGQMAMLAERVQKAGGILILAGDRNQIQAIGRGGSFSHIADQFGKVTITDVVRQKKQIDRDVIDDLVNSRVGKVLQHYAASGLLAIEDDQEAAAQKLVDEWVRGERLKEKKDSLIFVGTNKDAELVNDRCQRARIQSGEMSSVIRTSAHGQTFHMGDRVLFEKKSRSIGVENGETGTVVGINPLPILKTLTVKLDDGQKVFVPLCDYKKISLGYAVTTHKGQGSTVDRAYVLFGGSMQDKELSYVQLSRAREETRLYCAKAEAGDQYESLAKQMKQSNEKTLALSMASAKVRERLKQREVARFAQRGHA